MLVRTKTRLTKKTRVRERKSNYLLFKIPADAAGSLPPELRKYQVRDVSPWREAFDQEISNTSEGGMILKAERALANLTQEELAEMVDVAQHVISEIESGKRPIGKKMARRLAKVLKTDYRMFL